MNRMKTEFERVTHQLTVAFRRLFGGAAEPHTAERELKESIARQQAEGPRAAQARVEGRWEDEGGAVTPALPRVPERP